MLAEAIRPFVDASPEQVRALRAHYELVVRWNQVVNLTRIDDWRQAVTRHYGESAILCSGLGWEAATVVDIGSGGGFPGVPLAILNPHSRVTLVESDQRKGAFLKEACRHMENCRVLIARSESVEGEFEWLVSRAVTWADVEPAAARLAKRVAILVGGTVPESLSVRWIEHRRLPWGSHRFLLIGEVVSRGT